jgi:dethiobiotin synthetase
MRLFVTGTDTDVGKTVVTACLAREARGRGTVVAAKPVASGVAPGSAGEDAERIGRAAGHAGSVVGAHPWETFEAPLSPHRAAALAGRTVSDAVLDGIAALRADTVLVEGVGGWRVPLRLGPRPLWVADLARATGGAVVIVAADRIGVLNHALLTAEAVRADGFTVAGIVLNRGVGPHGATGSDPSRAYNAEDLRQLLDVPVVALPAVDLADDGALLRAGEALARGIFGPGWGPPTKGPGWGPPTKGLGGER